MAETPSWYPSEQICPQLRRHFYKASPLDDRLTDVYWGM